MDNIWANLFLKNKHIRHIIASWEGLPGNARGSIWLLSGGLFATVMVTGIKFAGQRLPVLETPLLGLVFA